MTRVLLTMVGAQTSPGIIKALKEDGEIYIVGIDPTKLVSGAYMVDSFHHITASFIDENKYIEELFEICKKEKVEIILPCGNEDCLAITRAHERFDSIGVKIASSEYDTLNIAFDKYTAYNFVKESCPEFAPEFYLIKTPDDFIKYSNILGYPDRKIVMKPRHGRGGRGVYVIEPDLNFGELLRNKPEGRYPFSVIKGLLDDEFEEFILMEYLPGKIFSTYALCENGNSLTVIPHVRIWGNASNTLIGRVELDEEITEGIKKINKKFNFNFNVNYELKEDQSGLPKIFDINPRMAASTAIFRNIGINIPYLSIKLALGEKTKAPEPKEGTVMMRYLEEINLDVKNGKIFTI